MSHTPFIIAAYAVFAAVFLIDAGAPVRARRRLLSQWRARIARERRRSPAAAEENA
jgi:heme exporter protein CcmD